MFGEIKKILGIEGVKIDVEIREPAKKSEAKINGVVKLTTLNTNKVTGIAIKLVEKYTRGRKDSKLIDEYTIGFVDLDEVFEVQKNDNVEIPFELPFKLYQSEMDKMQGSNFFAAGLVLLAKKAKGVKSEYRLEAEAYVTGTKLNPLCKKEIELK
jgi:hypothetical protein